LENTGGTAKEAQLLMPTNDSQVENSPLNRLIEKLLIAIEIQLSQHPLGIKEFDLLQKLRKEGFFQAADTEDPNLMIFRNHFLLFHCLYRLRAQLISSGIADLRIHTLSIQRLPLADCRASLSKTDNLGDYYLDLSNITNTSSEDVELLISGFWQAYAKGGYGLSQQDKQSALSILGLDSKASKADIKLQYRRLAMRHHPDRGGDTETLKSINLAARQLLA